MTDDELAEEADHGMHGNGAMVEANRRLQRSQSVLTWVMVALTAAILIFTAFIAFPDDHYLEQIWPKIAQEPRYITYAAIIFDAAAVIFILLSALQKGPVGSQFSGKRAADGSGRQGPRPGHEPDSVVRRRWIFGVLGILLLMAGGVIHIVAYEMQLPVP